MSSRNMDKTDMSLALAVDHNALATIERKLSSAPNRYKFLTMFI